MTDGEFILKVADLGDLVVPKQKLTKITFGLAVMFYGMKQFLTGKRQFVSKELFNVIKINMQMTNEKVVKELGFAPKPLDERIKQTVDWYKKKYGK